MKKGTLVYIRAVILIVVGVISILVFYQRLDNLEIPFEELTEAIKLALLLSISLIGLFTLIVVLYLTLLLLKNEWVLFLKAKFNLYIERPKPRIIFVVLLLMVIIISTQFLLQGGDSDKIFAVIFIWVFLTSFISLGFLFAKKDNFLEYVKPDLLIPVLLAVAIMALLVILNSSKYGFNKTYQPSNEGVFRLTGFPILDYQVLISWIVVVGGVIIIHWMVNRWGKGKKISGRLVDLIIMISLFVITFLISNSTSVVPNAFIDQPRPPNYTISPNLDAEIYERTAQSLLATGKMQTYIGGGYNLVVARRPLFGLYLAVLHQVAGLGYEEILPLQLLLFSLVPVLIYLFTKTLHNRISAVLAAVLMIIRHQNGLLLAHNVWGGTNLQMLMSDFLAMMIVILFLFMSIIWIKNFSENSLYPIILGGVLGLGILIRQELLILIPIVSIVALFGRKFDFKIVFKQFLLLFIGLVVVVTPWICRNWLQSGKIYLDKPGNQIESIIWTFKGGDKDSDVIIRENPVDMDEISVVPIDSSFQEENDVQLSRIELVGNHYANAIQQFFLYLPSNPLGLNADYIRQMVYGKITEYYGGVLYSPYKYAKSLPYWWYDQWDGKIDGKSWIYLTGVVGLISLGIYQVWKKERWITFVPVLAVFGMVSIYAFSLISGGRLQQSVDWLSAMFMSIGLVELSRRFLDYWRNKDNRTNLLSGTDILENPQGSALSNRMITLIFIGIVLLGASPVIAEILIPNHYPESELEHQLSSLLGDENSTLKQEDRELLRNFTDQGGEVIYGRALYPRYFPPDAELMTGNLRLFTSSTTFTIAGTELNFVILPRVEPPRSFPHGVDVLVFGCREVSFQPDPDELKVCLSCYTEGFDALAVIQLNEDQATEVLWRDGDQGDNSACPLVWPGE